MAADVIPEADCPNPLCSEIKKRHDKLQKGREYLRKSVKILEEQLDKITKEKSDLKRAHEELLMHEKQNKEAMDKESSIRDKLKKEIHDMKAEISSYQKNECFKSTDENEIQLLRGRILDAEEEIRSLKHLLEKEKQKTDSEKKKSVLEKKKAEEAWKLVKLEKNKAEEERRVAETEKKKAEQCRICFENLEHETNEVRKKLTAEMSKAEGSRKMVEEERQKTIREKKRAESERVKDDNHKRLMEVERRKVVEQKASADHLSQMLEEEKRGREELQKKFEEAVSAAKVRCRCSSSTKDDIYHGGTANVNLLREQLKLEKKQVKHAKRMAKLEKAEKKFIKQELHLLKQNFMQVFCRFNMLHDHLLRNIEGGETKIGKKSGMVGRNNMLDAEGSNRNSSISLVPIETCCTGPFDCTEPERQCIDLSLSRECRTRPITGIISESESPVGGSVKNTSQSSAVCSNTTSFSDEKSMGSQGKDFIGVTTSAKLKYSSTVPKLPSGVAKTRKNKGNTVSPNNTRKSGQIEVENAQLITSSRDAWAVTDPQSYRSSKRRKIQGPMEHVSLVRTADTGMHIDGLLPLRNTDDSLPPVKLSSICGMSKDFDSRIDFVNKKQDELYRNIYDPSSKITVKEQQTYVQQKQTYNFDSQRRRDLLGGTVLPSHQVLGNVCIEQTVNALSKEQDDLVYFENMISGNYMKLLDLENDADAEKYRLALEMPLSPGLPIVEPPNCQSCLEDNSQYLTEKQKSMPCHSFDVVDLEVSCNSSKLQTSNAILDVLSCGKQDVVCPMEGPANSCLITLCSDASRHDELHDGKQKSYFPATSKTPEEITKMACNDINEVNTVPSLLNSGDHQQAKPLLPCHLDPKEFPKSSTFLAAANAETDKSLLLGNAADPYPLLEDGCFQSCSTGIGNLVTSTSLVVNKTLGHSDATDLCLIESPIEGGGVSSDGSLFSRSINEMLAPEMRKFLDSDNNTDNTGQAEPSSICQSSEGSEQISLYGSPKIVDLCRGNAEVEGFTPSYCVLFSKTERKVSILRMLSLKNKFKHQNLMTSQSDHVLVEVLNALTSETALLPEEKVSILFSTLLCNISSRLEANSKSAMADDLLLCLECFAVEINRVMSDGETASRFQETCRWDILVSLIEDFLIEREVLMCTDRQYEPMSPSDSCSDILEVDGGQMHVYSRAATVYQYVAGCVILASMSSAFHESSFLHEVSYKILLTCKSDTFWALLALHAFASVCGKDFFEINEQSLLIAAIRSVVSLLESGDEAVPLVSSCPSSGSTPTHKFAPCKECPFEIGAMCIDKLTDMLLEVLQCCLTGVENPNVTESFAVAVPTVSADTVVDGQSSDRSKFDGLLGCDEFHCVLDSRSDLPRCLPRRPFCDFTDIVSLVELVAFYMGWNWTYKKIIPHLCNMLESCISIEFSAGLVVLIGQLGRFGIDVGGYQQTGIPELRCSLSGILDACDAKKRGLPTQLAAVGALLNLLPLSFGDIVDHHEHPVDASVFGQAERIKNWFCKLSRQQQSICTSLFGESNFCEKMTS